MSQQNKYTIWSSPGMTNQIEGYTIMLGSRDKDELIDNIRAFGKLEKGWDFGQGDAASDDVINRSIDIYQLGKSYGLKSSARPTTEGGITVTFFWMDNFIDATINLDLSLDVKYEKGIGEDYEILLDEQNVALTEILNLLNTIRNQCFSSEHYMLINMTRQEKGSPVTVSSGWVTGYQYLTKPAREKQVTTPFAIISENSIQEQREIQLYSAELL